MPNQEPKTEQPQATAEQQVAAYIYDALQNRCTVAGDKSEMHSEAKRFMAMIAQGQLLVAAPEAPEATKPPGRRGPAPKSRKPRKS